MSAEVADSPWELDYSTYAVLADGRIVCRYRQVGTDHLAILDPRTGQLDQLGVPHTAIKPYLRAAHELYYPPTNQEAVGPAGQRPPLLVQPHPGPTAETTSRLDLRTQFFTSRGFAVVNVNYAGSSGHGRAYRERLTGQWGILDVADCINAAHHLTDAGKADPRRLLIAGASAGGYTALCALVFHDVFAAGTSYFGIADLETFRQQAPRFQAHQLDRLVGPYPQAADTYRTRSPLHAAGNLTTRLLLIQGLKDTVVPPAQAEAIANTLRQRGIPHTYLTFPEESHGLSASTSIRQALEVELAFYFEALGITPGSSTQPPRIRGGSSPSARR